MQVDAVLGLPPLSPVAILTAADTQIINNTASLQGGGISAASNTYMTFNNTDFSSNFGDTLLLSVSIPLLSIL